MKVSYHSPMNGEMGRCIEFCFEAHKACKETMLHCLDKGGKHAEAQHIHTLMECMEICYATASFLTIASPYFSQLCAICAEICEKCARDCARMREDLAMQSCASTCMQCADTCREMVRRAKAA
ncbi:MAG: four-helix bundle copper-binding protein [Candidatus Omnitrophica bacterium]|nr:four-helix bundle copper-binding protein [Candidatus Omnitrophota bacterium]